MTTTRTHRDPRARVRRGALTVLTAMMAVGSVLLVSGCTSVGGRMIGTPTAPVWAQPTKASTFAPAAGRSGGLTSVTRTTPPAGNGTSAVVPGTNHNSAAAAYAYPAAKVHDWYRNGPRAAGYPSHRLVFLTFDDGPTNRTTPQVLSVLQRYGVHATFFDIGKQVPQTDPQVLRDVIAGGNGICVHSYSHDYAYLYPHRRADTAHVVADYGRGLYALRKVLGDGFSCGAVRYPGGHMSWHGLAPSDRALAAEHVSWIDWNAMTGDAEPDAPTTTAGQLAYLKNSIAENGDARVQVVLMHDTYGKQLTIDSLPSVIQYFRSRGYDFGIIS